MSARRVSGLRCGTVIDWQTNRDKFPDARQVAQAKVYITEDGKLFLSTTQPWVDWLLGRREDMPSREER